MSSTTSKPMSGNGSQLTAGYTQLQRHHQQQQGHGRRRPASAAVETVLQFGYPRSLVTSAYRELCATSKASPADVQCGEAAGGIKAVALLKAVEDRLQSSVHGTADASSAAWHVDHAREITGSDDDEECEGGGTLLTLTPASDSREELSHFGHKPGADSVVRCTSDAAPANSAVRNTTATPVAATATESETIPSERGWCSRDAAVATNQGGVSGSLLCKGGSSHETLPAEVSSIQSETVPANLTLPAANTHRASLVQAAGSPAPGETLPRLVANEGKQLKAEAREREDAHTDQFRALRAENRRLKARNTCRHCRQRPASLTLLPCGHFCFCYECGSSFQSCPLCRKTILADVRTFVA